MRDQKPPELFVSERPVRSYTVPSGPSYAIRRLITVAVLLVVVGTGGYFVLHHSVPTAPGEIPTIKAEGNYKQKPQEPGGIDIPNQDMQVYQQLDSNEAPKQTIEHLLPPPEVPQASAPVPITPNVTSQRAHIESFTPAVAVAPPPTPLDTPPPPAPVPTTVMAQPVPAAASVNAVDVAPAPAPVEPVVAAKPAPAPAPKIAGAVPGSTVVQLAAVSDHTSAEKVMNELRTKYASVLGSTPLRLVRADLGKKGVFYRIQSQPISDDRASGICSSLKHMKAGCIIVGR